MIGLFAMHDQQLARVSRPASRCTILRGTELGLKIALQEIHESRRQTQPTTLQKVFEEVGLMHQTVTEALSPCRLLPGSGLG